MNRDDCIKRAQMILKQEIDTLSSLSSELNASFWECAQLLSNCKGFIWTTGVGTSAQVAARFAHILTCCGERSMFLSPADGLHGHTGVISPEDLLVAMSRGGESDEVNQMVTIASSYRIPTIAFLHNLESTLARTCSHVLHIESQQEYELMGLIATTSTVAFSAMCDALCAIVIEINGYSAEQLHRTHPGGAVGKRFP